MEHFPESIFCFFSCACSKKKLKDKKRTSWFRWNSIQYKGNMFPGCQMLRKCVSTCMQAGVCLMFWQSCDIFLVQDTSLDTAHIIFLFLSKGYKLKAHLIATPKPQKSVFIMSIKSSGLKEKRNKWPKKSISISVFDDAISQLIYVESDLFDLSTHNKINLSVCRLIQPLYCPGEPCTACLAFTQNRL